MVKKDDLERETYTDSREVKGRERERCVPLFSAKVGDKKKIGSWRAENTRANSQHYTKHYFLHQTRVLTVNFQREGGGGGGGGGESPYFSVKT